MNEHNQACRFTSHNASNLSNQTFQTKYRELFHKKGGKWSTENLMQEQAYLVQWNSSWKLSKLSNPNFRVMQK